jgi:hypothetical protein
VRLADDDVFIVRPLSWQLFVVLRDGERRREDAAEASDAEDDDPLNADEEDDAKAIHCGVQWQSVRGG